MASYDPRNDILDAPIGEAPKPRRHLYVPLITLTIGGILTLLVYGDVWKLLQVGFIASLYFLPLRYQLASVASIFLLSTFQLLEAFPFYIGFQFSAFILDLFSLAGLAMTIYIGHEELREFLLQIRPPLHEQQGSHYHYFRRRFDRLPTRELRHRLQQSGLREEARQALTDLLAERNDR